MDSLETLSSYCKGFLLIFSTFLKRNRSPSKFWIFCNKMIIKKHQRVFSDFSVVRLCFNVLPIFRLNVVFWTFNNVFKGSPVIPVADKLFLWRIKCCGSRPQKSLISQKFAKNLPKNPIPYLETLPKPFHILMRSFSTSSYIDNHSVPHFICSTLWLPMSKTHWIRQNVVRNKTVQNLENLLGISLWLS